MLSPEEASFNLTYHLVRGSTIAAISTGIGRESDGNFETRIIAVQAYGRVVQLGHRGDQAQAQPAAPTLDPAKFRDPFVTAKGEQRAIVALEHLDTLWFNTGTLCNIECGHCYIESSPSNDSLEYLGLADVQRFLDEIDTLGLLTGEIGFTGGEPFMNPEVLDMLGEVLGRGYDVLVLTNGMQPMMRPAMQQGLLELREAHGKRLGFRVSIDHHSETLHDSERGAGSFAKAVAGSP